MKARKQNPSTPSAIVYCRVSTLGQVEQGVSLQAQEASARAWCQANGLQVASVHVDEGISGGSMSHRPGLQAALVEARRLKAPVVAYSLSRITRSVRDAIDLVELLERVGSGLVSLSERLDTSSASGRFVFTTLSAVGQLERELVGERTRAALAYKRGKGERTSRHPPIGFRHQDGRVVEDEQEQATIRILQAWRAEGLTFRELVTRANREGLACRGESWRLATVHKALTRE